MIFFLLYVFISIKIGWGLAWYDYILAAILTFLTLFAEKIRMNLAIMGARNLMQRELEYVKFESKEIDPFDIVTETCNNGCSGI